MLVSYNWLKNYINLTISPAELADKLNIAGLPVEEITEKKAPFTNVVIGKVLAVEKHPQADNLNLCDVSDGTETLKIVCGAANVAAGQTIALARIGAVLPGDFKIKKAKIRGVESNGMICSESELGLAKESSGIMVLDEKKYTPGQPFEPVKPDTIFSLEITPNRPDLLCVTGVARFISSRLGIDFKYPSCEVSPGNIDQSLDAGAVVKIENLDAVRCPRYAARVIKGVKISDSPEWLKEALTAVGVRPINNVVDITNYILMEINHPLHAFDLSKLKGKTIKIRTAVHGEKILALDTKEYHPHAEDLVIADDKDPVALAGIMGGEHYSVDSSTSTVVLESACFQPKTVRKTSRRLGVSSDSSYRFERGINIDNVTNALNRAVELIIQVAGGKASKNITDIYPSPAVPKVISLRFARVNQILDMALSAQEIKALIEMLYFPINNVSADSMEVTIPGYRVDISEEIDLIEDIAQIMGYDKIPVNLPASLMGVSRESGIALFKKSLSNSMMSCGFSEVINYSFVNNKLLKQLKAETPLPEGAIALKNPFNDEETHMKTTLLPDLIKNLITNYNNENENIHIFEVSNSFLKHGSSYLQLPKIGAVTYGSVINQAFNRKEFTTDFYYLKSVIGSLCHTASPEIEPVYKTAPAGNDFYEYFAEISINGRIIGTAGQIKQDILYDNKFKSKAFAFEIDIEALYSFISKNTSYSHIARFPSVKRDISVVVKDSVAQASVESLITADYKALIKSLTLFDLYKGSQVPEGSKSLSYNIIFQSEKKTLSEQDINKAMERIIGRLKSELQAELRS